MGLILSRSPFNVSREGFDPNVEMVVEIGFFKEGIFSISQTYNINYRNSYYVDISNIVRDKLKENYTYSSSLGRYTGGYNKNVIVRTTIRARTGGSTIPDIIEYYLATDGFLYSLDAMNYDYSDYLDENSFYAGSSDTIYKLDDSNIRIPLINPTLDVVGSQVSEVVTMTTFLKGSQVQSVSHTFDSEYSSTFTKVLQDSSYNSFLDRVKEDGGIHEESSCLRKFFRNNELNNIDKIILSSPRSSKVINVKSITECKYDPYRLTFKNRFGINEDLWFFKKSSSSISFNAEKFRSNQIGARSAGDLTRTNQEYNKTGIESITLNSGFVDEAINESFKQLMLSEKVELYDFKNDTVIAVKVKDSELKIKTSTNDKLINYTLELEISNNIIDDIV